MRRHLLSHAKCSSGRLPSARMACCSRAFSRASKLPSVDIHMLARAGFASLIALSVIGAPVPALASDSGAHGNFGYGSPPVGPPETMMQRLGREARERAAQPWESILDQIGTYPGEVEIN